MYEDFVGAYSSTEGFWVWVIIHAHSQVYNIKNFFSVSIHQFMFL